MAHIIKFDGEVIPFERQTGVPAIYSDIEMMLNIVVDRVDMPDGRAMFIGHNEHMNELNKLAMLIMGKGSIIFGNVIILEKFELGE